jgi:hypothetical protein
LPTILDRIATSLLRQLPLDGTPIPNRAARALVTQDLARLVSLEDYFAARDRLIDQRKVGRVRGQGGSVFLLIDVPDEEPPALEPTGIPSERSLMDPLGVALRTQFRQWLDLPPQGTVEVADIAQARSRGQWANPDYLLVSVCPLSVLAGAQIDVHVFELKNEAGGRIQAVHEALAHGRFAHFAHLVWYLPHGSRREAELEQIAAHCRLHGVGLIRMFEDKTIDAIVDPVRTRAAPLEIDGFVEARLAKQQVAKLREAMGSV